MATAVYAQDKNEEQKNKDLWGDKPVEFYMKMSWDFNHPDVIGRENISDASLFGTDLITHSLYYGLRSTIDDRGPRVGASLAYFLFGVTLLKPIRVWNHEEGHLQVLDRLPDVDHDNFTFVDDNGDRSNIDNSWDTLRYVLDSWGQDAAVSVDDKTWIKLNTDPELKPHFGKIVTLFEAGGLNQDQYTLEQHQRRILLGREHIFNAPVWFGYLNSTLTYSTHIKNGDIDDYLDDLGNLGVDSSVKHVKNVQWLKYISGSTLTMLNGFRNWVLDGKPVVSRDDYFLPVLLPEWSSYLTTHGPTLKAWMVREWFHGIWVEPSFQYAIDDAKHDEYGMKINFVENWYTVVVGGYINRGGKGSWLDGEFIFTPLSFLDIGVGVSHGHGYTYEREIRGKTFDFLETNELDLKGTLGVSCRF